MARSKKKWDESSVTRDENGRFVAWSMDIQVGGQRIQRSGSDAPQYRQPPAQAPYGQQYPPGMTPQHQNMIELKRQLDQKMWENQQRNTVWPAKLSSRRTSKKPKSA
jgi:hypothetical protein